MTTERSGGVSVERPGAPDASRPLPGPGIQPSPGPTQLQRTTTNPFARVRMRMLAVWIGPTAYARVW